MNFEIRGIGTNNKGAYLMCLSIINYWQNKSLENKFYIDSAGGVTETFYREHDVRRYKNRKWYHKFLNTKKIPFEMPEIAYRMMSQFDPVDVIFDASGFLYGDQWSVDRIYSRTTKNIKTWKKEGKKFILLPQAFGPFDDERIKRETGYVIDNADLVCVRDMRSYEYLINTYGKDDKIKLYPDFTNILEVDYQNHISKNSLCLIPNSKMLKVYQLNEYIELINIIVSRAMDKGLNAFILCHEESEDYKLAQDIVAQINFNIEVITESNPLIIKSIIKSSSIVFTSRFHGLVSALSQAIPAMATSWSHKYELLMKDYEMTEYLVNSNNIEQVVDNLIANSEVIRQRLRKHSHYEKQKTIQMWEEVEKVIHG